MTKLSKRSLINQSIYSIAVNLEYYIEDIELGSGGSSYSIKGASFKDYYGGLRVFSMLEMSINLLREQVNEEIRVAAHANGNSSQDAQDLSELESIQELVIIFEKEMSSLSLIFQGEITKGNISSILRLLSEKLKILSIHLEELSVLDTKHTYDTLGERISHVLYEELSKQEEDKKFNEIFDKIKQSAESFLKIYYFNLNLDGDGQLIFRDINVINDLLEKAKEIRNWAESVHEEVKSVSSSKQKDLSLGELEWFLVYIDHVSELLNCVVDIDRANAVLESAREAAEGFKTLEDRKEELLESLPEVEEVDSVTLGLLEALERKQLYDRSETLVVLKDIMSSIDNIFSRENNNSQQAMEDAADELMAELGAVNQTNYIDSSNSPSAVPSATPTEMAGEYAVSFAMLDESF